MRTLKISLAWHLVFVACFLSSVVYAEKIVKIIARVNNEVITTKDLNDYCTVLSYRLSQDLPQFDCKDENFRKQALERLLEDRLISDKAKNENFQIPSYWVETKVNEIASSYPSFSDFEKSLIDKGLTITLLKEKIKEQYLVRQAIEKYVRASIHVSPQEISQYYKNNLDNFQLPDIYVLWIGKSEDDSILKEIAHTIGKKGIQYAAEKYPNIFVKIESNLSELREEISKPIVVVGEGHYIMRRIDNTPHIIYLERIIPAHLLSVEEVKESIRSSLWEKKFKEKFDEWLKELKGKAFIKIYP